MTRAEYIKKLKKVRAELEELEKGLYELEASQFISDQAMKWQFNLVYDSWKLLQDMEALDAYYKELKGA